MALAEKLVELRRAKGLSQLELADMLGVSRQAVSKWELGTAVPTVDNLKYLGGLYKVSMDYLLNDDASEQDQAAPEPGKERTKEAAERKRLRTAVAVLAALTVILAVGLFTAVIYKRPAEEGGTRVTSMDDIEGVAIEPTEIFELVLINEGME